MDAAASNRLKWKCRRGLLELDLVLARFLPTLGSADVQPLLAMLDLPDNDLWDIVSGRSDDYDPEFNDVVTRLRAV
jgi:antitoxin CptB